MNVLLIKEKLSSYLDVEDFEIKDSKIILPKDNIFKIELYSSKTDIKCELFIGNGFMKTILTKDSKEFRESGFYTKIDLCLFLSYYESISIFSEKLLSLLIESFKENKNCGNNEDANRLKNIILKTDSSKTYLFNLF